MKEYYLCLDVGGTEIKCALLSQPNKPVIHGEIKYFPANAQGSKTEIISHFCNIIAQVATANDKTVKLSGVRMAFPGPFDYPNGICLLQGLTKYDSIYKVNLKQTLESELRQQNKVQLADEFDIRFVNDVGGFALGELNFGRAKSAKRAIFVCIGTGCGSAFSLRNNLTDETTPNVPPNGYIFDLPFKNSRIDDYISKRGLCHISHQIFGEPLEGYELSQRALGGDEKAILCFNQFGDSLHEALIPIVNKYSPDCLVLGGQVMKSAPLFIAKLENTLNQNDVSLFITTDTSEITLKGLLTI